MANLDDIKALCRGVAEWNSRRRNVLGKPDLSHLELRNAVLREADLQEVDFDGARLSNVDLRGANLTRARLNGVKVSRATFEDATLTGMELKGADFTRACFRGAHFDRSEGLDLKLRHSDLAGARMENCRLRMTHFYNCDLQGLSLIGTKLDRSLAKRVALSPVEMAALSCAGCEVELPNATRPEEWLDWGRFAVAAEDDDFGIIQYQGRAYWIAEGRWDFFVSHASEDKNAVARPLAEALRERQQRVWFDETTIRAGERLDEVIAFGTRSSVFGVIVVSPRFFGRRWTEAELQALEQKRLFLVLHDMDVEALKAVRPTLADRLWLPADMGPQALADALLEAARQPPRQSAEEP